MKRYVLCTPLTKRLPDGTISLTCELGIYWDTSKEVALGKFVIDILERNPGYALNATPIVAEIEDENREL